MWPSAIGGYLFDLICDLSPARLVEVAGGLLCSAAVYGNMGVTLFWRAPVGYRPGEWLKSQQIGFTRDFLAVIGRR